MASRFESSVGISCLPVGYLALLCGIPLTIGAGAGGAVVDLLLAVEPCITRGALAEVASIRVISAAPAIGAWPVSTRHGAQLAVVAVKAVRTSALICVFQVL